VGLVTFMVLTIALALPHAHFAVVLTMPTPLVAVALITFLRTPRGRRKELWASLGVRHLGLRSWPVAFVVSVILILVIPYGVADLLGSAALVPLSSSAQAWLNGSLALLITLVGLTIMGMTEEIGWRGFLLPRVQTMVSKRRAALVVGFIHGLFHMPLVLLTTTYDSVGSRWIVAPSVMVLVTAAGVFYAWLKDRSGSVWPVAVAHSTVNTLLEGGGLVVIVSPVALAYTAGESGIVTAVAVVGFAVVLLIRGRTWAAAPVAHSTPAEPVA
jgi:membrane protease YdiL (CAAX protease family)